MLQRWFRYPISDVYMVLGLTITFLTFFFSRTIIDQRQAKKEDQQTFQYNASQIFNLSFGETEDLKKLFDVPSGVFEIPDVSVALNDLDNTVVCSVVLRYNEKPEYQLSEGAFPTTEEMDGDEHIVLLGRAYKDICYERDGQRYIMAQNEEYRVGGIIGTETSNAQDYSVVFFWDACGSGIRRIIESYETISVLAESNYKTTNELYELLLKNNESQKLNYLIIGGASSASISLTQNSGTEQTFYQLLYLFCMINCLIIAEFWVSERKYDVCMRRILGYSVKKVYIFLYGQLLKPVCVASACCILFQGISRFLRYEDITLQMRLTVQNVLWIFVGVLFSSAIVASAAVWQTMRENPVEAVRNG